MMGFTGGSGISWTIYKQSASRSRQITTSTPHHLIFTGLMLFLTPKATNNRFNIVLVLFTSYMIRDLLYNGQLMAGKKQD